MVISSVENFEPNPLFMIFEAQLALIAAIMEGHNRGTFYMVQYLQNFTQLAL